jgi:hypothetical protein
MREKETWEKTTGVDAGSLCDRAEDLVTYLYGEADVAEARAFAAHAQSCASCRRELAQFKEVRLAVGDWRAQALGSATSETFETSSPAIIEHGEPATARKRSALAAIREFFSLSPVWLRAATATMGVVFCVLMSLAVARFFEHPKTVTVERVVRAQPSEAELARMVDERIRQQHEAARPAQKDELNVPVIEQASAVKPVGGATPDSDRVSRPDAARQREIARKRAPQLKISPQESREIARDLRLTIASNDEDDLPRLSDLMEESN